jgi:hypothetical protein
MEKIEEFKMFIEFEGEISESDTLEMLDDYDSLMMFAAIQWFENNGLLVNEETLNSEPIHALIKKLI